MALRLYEGQAHCAACHPSQPEANGESPLFTDFTYDNLGVPRNPANPFYAAPKSVNRDGPKWIDPGLGGFLAAHGDVAGAAANWGKQKVPTLRNVDLRPHPGFVKAFGHNGYFKSLEEIVHFYNTRDVGPWPPPEVGENVNRDELGNLGLSLAQEAAIVAFLRTLSDGYVPPARAAARRGSAEPVEPDGSRAAMGTQLFPSWPNPASREATIAFALPAPAAVLLTVYDLNGREIRTLASGGYAAGTHALVWDGRDGVGNPVGDGAYFYRLRAGDVDVVRKLIWIR